MSCRYRRVRSREAHTIQAEPSDRGSWLALTRAPSEWQHAFGPTHAPVVIAGVSAHIAGLVTAIRSLGQREQRKCLIVEGPHGAGKSLAAAAFQAACQHLSVAAVLVNEGSDPNSLVERVRLADALIVDNLDRLTPGLRQTMFTQRHQSPHGTLCALTRLSAVERALLNQDDALYIVEPLETRPSDVLVMAGMMWRDLGLAPDLPDLCADGVPELISQWPWTNGGHSIRRFLNALSDALAVEGYFDHSPRPIELTDVQSALVAVIREERPPIEDDLVRIVVEGSTDVIYFEAAGRLALEAWGSDLLAGCRVTAAGHGREGGARMVVRSLIELESLGTLAVGIFDDDEPGRQAIKDARLYTKYKSHLLPFQFDPLKSMKGTAKIEVEDLVPSELIQRFYEANDDIRPEEQTTRGDRVRIVIGGRDKERAARWICEHASFAEIQRLVYVLCMLRESIGLPLPSSCPPLADWLRSLSLD